MGRKSLLSGLKKGARNTWTTASQYVGRIAFHIVAKWYQLRDIISPPKRDSPAYQLLPQSSPEGSTEPGDLMSDPEPAARQDMDYSSIKFARLRLQSATDTSCFTDMRTEEVQAPSQGPIDEGLEAAFSQMPDAPTEVAGDMFSEGSHRTPEESPASSSEGEKEEEVGLA